MPADVLAMRPSAGKDRGEGAYGDKNKKHKQRLTAKTCALTRDKNPRLAATKPARLWREKTLRRCAPIIH